MRADDNMSELVDLRAKITPKTDAYLDARSAATGDDKASIVRDLLHAVASREIDEISVLHRSLRSKGFVGESGGKAEGR